MVPVRDIYTATAALDCLAVDLEVRVFASCCYSLHTEDFPMQAQQQSSYCLIVLDSVPALVTPVLGAGAAGNMQGHALMILLAQQLKACAEGFQLAVLVTNTLVGGKQACPVRKLCSYAAC